MAVSKSLQAYRGDLLDFVDDPFYVSPEESLRYIPDGLLVIENGVVKELGTYNSLKDKYIDIPVTYYPGMLIMPGFVDTHIHFPQTEIIASYGEQLLEWLEKYTFPTEAKFQDKIYARKVASIFLDGCSSRYPRPIKRCASARIFFNMAQYRTHVLAPKNIM